MWRLSWITFIFLPLTFTVGFFGMNVDIFSQEENNPPLKWWFIVSVPILCAVLILWYAVKHNFSTQRQNPLRRGVYEALYHELATEHSALWSRKGPRPGIIPIGWWNAVKWTLITSWFSADKIRLTNKYDPATEEFGAWSRCKQYLVRRWLGEIEALPPDFMPNTPPSVPDQQNIPLTETSPSSLKQPLGAVGELLSIATPVAIAELDPTAASRLQERVPVNRLRSLSPTYSDGGSSGGRRMSGGRRPSSDAGVMVEEKGPSEDEKSGDESGREAEREREREKEELRRGRLEVPF